MEKKDYLYVEPDLGKYILMRFLNRINTSLEVFWEREAAGHGNLLRCLESRAIQI